MTIANLCNVLSDSQKIKVYEYGDWYEYDCKIEDEASHLKFNKEWKNKKVKLVKPMKSSIFVFI